MTPETTTAALRELWRREMYPHVEPDVFERFFADLTAGGWDDIRVEVAAVERIIAALSLSASRGDALLQKLKDAAGGIVTEHKQWNGSWFCHPGCTYWHDGYHVEACKFIKAQPADSRGDALREALAETIQVIKDRVKYTPERIARWEAVLGVTTTIPGNRTGCRDCGTPYGGDDWIDTRLTREQWRLIAPEDGILCANCIVKRAAKLPNVVSLVARIEFARDVARRAEFLDTQEGADAALAEATGAPKATPSANTKCDGNHGGPRCADPECWNQ